MKIKLINPNTTQSMTDGIQRVAEQAASPGTIVYSVSPKHGPACIEGYVDQAIAVPGLLEEIIKGDLEEDADAFVVACFADPGINAARQVTDKPVIGISQAAMTAIRFLAPNFTVMGNEDGGEEYMFEMLHRNGSERFYKSSRYVGMSIMEVEENPEKAMEALKRECRLAIEEDHAEGVILGCAGFVPFAEELKKIFPIPIMDGVSPAVKIAEMMVYLNQKTSKVASWAYPLAKEVPGYDYIKPAQR